MSSEIGFDASTPSVPSGGGAVGGLGETFTPDLSTGGGSFAIRLDLPNGPNDIGPRLQLRYDVGAGNGPFGLGFSLPLPRIIRSTARGYPQYDSSDALMLEGAGEILKAADGTLRLEVDQGAWRIEKSGEGFRLLDREGSAYLLGVDAAARLSNGARTFAWQLERIEDALGNSVAFEWLRDGGQLYLASFSYGPYGVQFDYEPRPDVLRNGRPGFLVSTGLRCRRITLLRPADAQPRIREWELAYIAHDANGCSLLSSVTLTGIDAGGLSLSAPVLAFGWTVPAAPSLKRFQSVDPGASPGPLGRGRSTLDLVDWTGDGLPDVLEVLASGRTRVWPNLGRATWGRPRPAGDLPSLGGGTRVALADLDGDGLADLVRADRPIDGFVPRDPSGGFRPPVRFRAAPAVDPASPGVRFTDLDGDGVVDLMASGTAGLSLFYRSDPGGWRPRPQVVSGAQAPVANLADPRIFLADMTGDGSDDLVRVDGGGVTYWPYLGDGRWDAGVTMSDPPELGSKARPEQILVADVDGDGCADIIQLSGDRVRVWINRSGVGFTPPREVRAVPTRRMTDVRVADMLGLGVPGLLWTMAGAGAGETGYFFLDLVGGSKPYLLASIDNGIGLRTEISYSTSSQEAARDLAAGAGWSTRLPVAIPVVSQLQTTDTPAGTVSTTVFRYSDGRYDGILREFAGFGAVQEDQIGDETAPTLRIRRHFSTGLDLVTGAEPRDRPGRTQWRAIRGRLLLEEHYGLDGSPAEGLAYDRLEQEWRVDADGDSRVPRLVRTVREVLERQPDPAATIVTENLAWDAAGNVTDSRQTSSAPGDPGATKILRTTTLFAIDAAGRFPAKPWRVTQRDGAGTVIADTVAEFDGAGEGTVGPQGIVSTRSALVFTDAMVAEIYGAAQPPNLAALGYTRRAGEDGWWVAQGRWTRTDDVTGLIGRATSALGGTTTFAFGADRCVPTSVTDPFGNSVRIEHDGRINRVTRLTDASGAAFDAVYDPLARLVTSIDPGDSAALPTHAYEYDVAALPATTASHTRAVSGSAATIDRRERWSGNGRLLERRVASDPGEVRLESRRYSARGLLARAYLGALASSAAYTAPADAEPHVSYLYDALGRMIRQTNPDGSVRATTLGPLTVEEHDEEDTRIGGLHQGTPTLRRVDPTGRLAAVEQRIGVRRLVSTYEYDVKGDLVRHTDAAGHVVRFWHDLLGRTVRVDRPEHASRSVYDAAGNAIEARSPAGLLVTRDFDIGNRPIAVHLGPGSTPAIVRFTYHDAGRPAPPDAGLHTIGGRLARIDDDGGTSVIDYDERGRISHKRVTPAGSVNSYNLDVTYRADGQLDTIRYPGSGNRFQLTYQYDARGLISAVPGVATAIDHDLAGRRTRVALANGTEQSYAIGELTGRLAAMRLSGPAGELRAQTFEWDLVGNLVATTSPDSVLTGSYAFDDVYRLVSAQTAAGESWTYRYDDAGALTFKSDVGAYAYGEAGAPPTCLTTAGTDHFTWSAMGEMASAPWGTSDFDAMGRLVRITDGADVSEFTYDYAGMRVRTAAAGHVRLTPDPLFSLEDGQLILNLLDGAGLAARRRAADGLTHFLHPDHLGGLAAVTDSAGAVTDTLRFDPFGALLARTGAGPALPVGYTGGEPHSSGLLYLSARWYCPQLGLFTSPDAIVQDGTDPLAWAAYVYCRDNPVTLTDPSGRSFWGIFLAALAIVALIVVTVICVVLDVFTLGTMTAPLAIGIIALGMVVGGVIGGLAAYQKGGNTDDIITGIFVGAAVGGWAAFFTVVAGGAGAGVAGGLHVSGFWGAVVAGAVNGAITGAALGFAAGFAGGKGTLDEIFTKMWQGALVGLVTGAVLGGLSYALKPPTGTVWDNVRDAYQAPPPGAAGAGAPPGAPSLQPATEINNFGQATQQTLTGLGTKGASAAGLYVFQALITGAASPAFQALVVDVAVGAWDLGYVPKILQEIGVIKVGGTF